MLSSLTAGLRLVSPSSAGNRVTKCAAALLISSSSFLAFALSAESSSSASCAPGRSAVSTTSTSPTALQVAQFPCRSDNYGYLVHCPTSGQTAAVDTPDAAEIDAQLKARGWTLTHIWNTHHHDDHAGGNGQLLAQYPEIQIYGPAQEKIPHRTHPVDQGDEFTFGGATTEPETMTTVQVLNVGGHTKGHIAYYLPSAKKLFCGDALFALGCGRMFEGTPSQFWTSLQKLRALPDDTVVYCAHEYTQANAKFALSVEPNNQALVERAAAVKQLRKDNQPTVPSLLGDEKATNPFLRVDVSDEILQNVGASASDPVDAFAKVRAAKDNFRG